MNSDFGISGPRPSYTSLDLRLYFTNFNFRHRQPIEMLFIYVTETVQIRVRR